MTSQFIKQFIDDNCQDYDIIVLKGFSPKLILELGANFSLLDNYIFKNERIALNLINETRLMLTMVGYKSSRKAICTCESLIKMCTQITGLDILQKKICVLENNFLELYPNPTTTSIPDFDSEDFMDTEGETCLYSAFYSFCICENGEQYIQYIDNFSMSNTCVTIKKLAEPYPFAISDSIPSSKKPHLLSSKNASLNEVMKELYENMALQTTDFAVEAEEAEEERILSFIQACKMLGCVSHFKKVTRTPNITPRQELSDLLKRIWGYESFRKLQIYKDLNVNHDVLSISQGTVIETVVQQAEHAYQDKKDSVNNVLLTSPTGAGKSLLFQLSAIFLAEQYGLLTIVVSPLVALMNDQVEGLTGYKGVATLNSNKTAAEKEAILRGVREGLINLLYLSPELLLSYTITSFIGNRKLGLLVVDEAHTVTTWGRDFRVDYWFLGDYLRKARRILKYPFPIFALTATAVWDPTGKNDMVFDTIRSLNMDPCIKFIGVVRRTNISFEIESSNISTNYEEKRKALTIKRIREALSEERKTIVYFPFKRTVDGIVLSDDVSDISDKITRYHASLFPDEKAINAEAFRNGSKPIMCATKAFGMGIDVSDIREVYHHAPTGCLSDYVQEIGRLARDPQIQGIAKIDFSTNDFRYIRRLHGLSAIKPYQLMQVLTKLMAIYRINGEKRNMLISSSDFNYIFPLSSPDMVDQNLKSCLLLISNDLLNKLRFHAIIVRPKSLFSKCFVEINKNETSDFYRLFHNYLKHITDTIYILDADKYWTEKYTNISFPQFKFKLAEGKIFKDFHVSLKNKVTLCLHDTVAHTRDIINEFFDYAHRFLNKMSSTHHRLSFNTMKEALPKSYDNLRREQFLETFRMLYATPNALGSNIATYCSVFSSNKTDSQEFFQLVQNGYENMVNLYLSAFDSSIHDTDVCTYCDAKDDIVKLCEFLNSLGIADYQRSGGDQPAIFVRINNPYYLFMLIRNKNYENDILNGIYEKYRFSERIFTYFFTTPMTDEQRWNFIEEYFLGATEERLLNFV